MGLGWRPGTTPPTCQEVILVAARPALGYTALNLLSSITPYQPEQWRPDFAYIQPAIVNMSGAPRAGQTAKHALGIPRFLSIMSWQGVMSGQLP